MTSRSTLLSCVYKMEAKLEVSPCSQTDLDV